MKNITIIFMSIILSSCGASNAINAVNENNMLESETQKTEWDAEADYINCLLVAMSRLQTERINLYITKKPLPNLSELTKDNPETNKWIRSYGLEYEKLDQLAVTGMLAEMAGITPSSGNQTGTIQVHDVIGEKGDVVKRTFDLELDRIDNTPTLIVMQRMGGK
jgi:hypothetical protein